MSKEIVPHSKLPGIVFKMQQIVRSMNPIQRVNRQNSIHVQELVFFLNMILRMLPGTTYHLVFTNNFETKRSANLWHYVPFKCSFYNGSC